MINFSQEPLKNLSKGVQFTLTAIAIILLSGCHKDNPYGLSESQQKGVSKIQSIADKSGGDWNKVPPEDQQFMIKGAGSEQSAKVMLQMNARHGPPGGGPPAGGPPGVSQSKP